MPLQLPDFIRSHPLPVLTYRRNGGEIVAANKAARRWFGYTPKQWSGMRLADLIEFDPDPPATDIFSGKAVSGSGEVIRLTGYYASTRDQGRKLDLVILNPLSQGSASELTAQNTRLDKIVTVSHNEIYVVHDPSLKIEFANPSALRNLGYTSKEIRAVSLSELFHFPDRMALQALLNALRGPEKDRLKLQLRFTRKDGDQYDADVLIQVLEEGQSFLMIVSDITDKLIAERKLRASVVEKETLIKEMHHRVKNNLQLISSIIYLKLATIEQPDIRNFLEDTRQKIRAIALIHERLLQTEKLDRVEMSDYLGKLIHDLQLSYVRDDLSLVINTSISPAIIDFDRAIISGLIVNELVTNAMKHAFAGRTRGVIDIDFRKRISSTGYELSVADDGVTLPDHIRPGRSISFGMQLVDVFVKQLGGRFDIVREKGTKFQIHF